MGLKNFGLVVKMSPGKALYWVKIFKWVNRTGKGQFKRLEFKAYCNDLCKNQENMCHWFK